MSGTGTEQQNTQKTQQNVSSSTTNPWGAQQPYLMQAFNGASNAFNQAQGAQAPSGFVAGMTPEQISNFQSMVGYGGSNGIPGWEGAAGQGTANAGAAGASGALSRFGAFDPSQTNNPNSFLGTAASYANDPTISGQVQAAMRDANQNAQDVTLPGMERSAAGSGNINSSRTGVAEGIVQRGLAQQAGDISAQLRGNAWNKGIDTAATSAGQNNNALLQAMMGQGSLGNSMFNNGSGVASQAINDQGNLFNIAGAGGSGLQGAQQANYDNQNQGYNFNTNAPFNAAKNLYSIAGGNNWGGSTNASGTSAGSENTQKIPSMLSLISAYAGAAGKAATMFA